jgi:hypothetical protein
VSSDLFDNGHYATGLRSKLRRSFELGPKYYLFDVPRYVRQRRRLGLPAIDLEALWNPVRSVRPTSYVSLALPPRYAEALTALAEAGVRFDNPRPRIEALVSMWWQVAGVAGDAIECGAYRGATSLLLAVLGKLEGISQTVHMLDTFAGMPTPSEFDSSRQSGEFTPPRDWPDVIRRQVAALGVEGRVEIHQGYFAETFPALAARDVRFAFAHIDANIYEGTREACEFTLPRMAKGGVVVFDDYNGLCDLGARLAIDSCLRDRKPQPLAECSAFLRT